MDRSDRDGLLLCELQAKIFEQSVNRVTTSSEIFIRRFMHSQAAKLLDNRTVLETSLQPGDLLDLIEEQYDSSDYGSIKYTADEMYWIGYIYRYFAYIKNMSSLQVYKIIKPRELRRLYLPYHTMDPVQAVERILEAKHLPMNDADEFQRQYKILKKHYQLILQEKSE